MAASSESERVQRPEKGEGHYKSNLRDIRFNLFEVFDRQSVLGKKPFEAVDEGTVDAFFVESKRVADEMAKSFVADDRNPTVFHKETNSITFPEGFKKSYKAYMDSELYMAGVSEGLGGANAPRSVVWAMNEMFVGANPSVYLSSALGVSIAEVLYEIGDDSQKKVAKQMLDKKSGATMVLTEPDAGSDVGAGRTKALPQKDGSWHIEGVKRFITGGENELADNIIHLVLARPEGAGPGTKGLSLFMVPKFLFDPDTGEIRARNGVYATNLEDKMGIKASPTCEMTFGEKHPAVGYLVGGEHNGIAQMFRVIENARMMIGVKSVSALSTGYLNALDYAKTRKQGPDMTNMANKTDKVPIINHPEVRRNLMTQKAYAEGLRALYLYTATVQDEIQMVRAETKTDEQDSKLKALNGKNDLLLPVVKGFGSERANHLLEESLQTFGGSGFLKDYPIEQYIRDAKIDTIYEGTTAIQAKDFFFRKILQNNGAAVGSVVGEIKEFSESQSGNLEQQRALLAQGVKDIEGMVKLMVDHAAGTLQPGQEKDIYKVGQNDERLLMAFGDLMVGYLLLRQAEVSQKKLDAGAKGEDEAFYKGKVVTAKFFAREVLPRLASDRKSAEMVDNEIMEMPDAAF